MHYLIFICLLLLNNLAHANPLLENCDGSLEKPCIVLDTENNPAEVKNFRDAFAIKNIYRGNIKGLDQLWISGSAAPSAKGWQTIKKHIQKNTYNKVRHIIVIDLREETHGYLNQDAINYTTQNNWINRDKKYQQIKLEETKWLRNISEKKILRNVLSHEQFKLHQYKNGMTLAVKQVSNEADLVKKNGLSYVRLMVSDHMKPKDEEIERFVSLVKSMPEHTWLHLHCRGGDGRTTTFMAMADMLQNAKYVSFEEIIKRQSAVSPYYNLSMTQRSNKNFTPYYEARLTFLKKFYLYAKSLSQGYQGTWVEWLNNNQ